MNYSASYFKKNMPEWKRKKDPLLSRLFYRRVAFYTASICANHNISANTVSYVSALVAILGCALFIPNYFVCNIIGAILFNLWLIMDCTDGNLARSVKKQPFGEFADGISSYILVGFMGITMGICAFNTGGVLFKIHNHWIILLGGLASISDTLMRLIYQKYKNTERALADKGVLRVENDKRTDHSQVGSLRVRIEAELGIGGVLPLIILLGTVFHFLDAVVLYCLLYYGSSCIVATMIYIKKAVVATKLYQDKMPQ